MNSELREISGWASFVLKRTARVAAMTKAMVGVLGVFMSHAAIAAWEPEKPVELIVPARTGSELDQRARLIQDIIAKHNLMRQPLSLVHKPGGGGAEGFLDVKNSKGSAYRLLIADNRIVTVPLATGVPFNWKSTTPVAMLALEQFALWTNTQSGYKSAKEYIEAVKSGGHGMFRMGGVGTGFMPDRFLNFAIEEGTTTRFNYVPFSSGKDVVALLDRKVDSTVNNPMEAVDGWRSGALTPQCVFTNARISYKAKITARQSWNDVPTCREAGLPVEYQGLLGIFMPAGASAGQVSYFIEVFKRMVNTPEWMRYMESGAFEPSFRTGSDFTDWLITAESSHQELAKRLRQEFPK